MNHEYLLEFLEKDIPTVHNYAMRILLTMD